MDFSQSMFVQTQQLAQALDSSGTSDHSPENSSICPPPSVPTTSDSNYVPMMPPLNLNFSQPPMPLFPPSTSATARAKSPTSLTPLPMFPPLNTITSSKSPPKLPRPIPALADEVIALDWNRSRAECQSQHLPPVTMNQLKRVLDVPSRLFPQPAFPRQIDHQDLARLVTNMASKALLDHKTRMLNFIQQLLRHFYREVRVLHEITLSMEQWDQFAREQYQIHAIPFPRQAQEFSQLMMVLSNHMSLLTQSELNLFSTQAIIQSLLRQYLQRISTHV